MRFITRVSLFCVKIWSRCVCMVFCQVLYRSLSPQGASNTCDGFEKFRDTVRKWFVSSVALYGRRSMASNWAPSVVLLWPDKCHKRICHLEDSKGPDMSVSNVLPSLIDVDIRRALRFSRKIARMSVHAVCSQKPRNARFSSPAAARTSDREEMRLRRWQDCPILWIDIYIFLEVLRM